MRSLFLFPSLLLAAALMAQTPALIDNDRARVLKVTDQPHAKTAPHEHKVNRVMVYLTPGRQEITPAGGQKAVTSFRAGEVKWSPASSTHVSEVVSEQPVGIVEVELKKTGGEAAAVSGPLDTLKVDPKHYHLEFENPQVRVIRVHIGAHEKVPLHEHKLNRLVIYLTEQKTRTTTADGKVETVEHHAGEVSEGGAVKHSEENINDQAFEAVVVEFKS